MSGNLPVMEHFYTLQGEGAHSGKAAYFIRLAGCNVGCVWCDVKESWDDTKYAPISINQLLNFVINAGAKNAVITGGEPCMHNLNALTALLQENNIQTHLETSGAYKISGYWDWICVSPKKFKAPLPDSLVLANELKEVVYNNSDFKWAANYAEKVSTSSKLYLQPEWDKQHEVLPLIIQYIKENPQWQISLQTHKFMQIP